MIVPHETRVTPWAPFGHYGLSHYRVWLRKTDFGMFQRHEWKSDSGEVRFDRWIPSSGKTWGPGAEPTDADRFEDAAELLCEALRAIEAGHNDPRSLARETLEAVEGKL